METNRQLYDKYKESLKGEIETPINLGVYSNTHAISGGIMMVGMNPSGTNDDPNGNDFFEFIHKDNGTFWKPKREMLGEYVDKCAYIDLLPYKNGNQTVAIDKNDIRIRGILLSVTREYIEEIRPRLIIFCNSSNYYWGFNKKHLWMGYNFKKIESPLSGAKAKWGLFKITGITPTDVNKNAKTTNLENALFLQYRQHRTKFGNTVPPEQMIEFEDLKEIAKMIDIDWEKKLY